jgi:hypothetical protein
MQDFARLLLVLLLVFTLAVQSAGAQAAPLTKNAERVSRKAGSLVRNAPISVVRIHADEEFGTFVSSDKEAFTFYDIDRKAEVTLRYVEVKKIKDGYGGYNHVRGRHTDRTHGLIAACVVLGLIGGLLVAVATAKD